MKDIFFENSYGTLTVVFLHEITSIKTITLSERFSGDEIESRTYPIYEESRFDGKEKFGLCSLTHLSEDETEQFFKILKKNADRDQSLIVNDQPELVVHIYGNCMTSEYIKETHYHHP